APAVVAPARIPLRVLVRQGRAEGGEDLGAREVLARDELQAPAQPVELGQEDAGDVGVERLEGGEVGTVEALGHEEVGLSFDVRSCGRWGASWSGVRDPSRRMA